MAIGRKSSQVLTHIYIPPPKVCQTVAQCTEDFATKPHSPLLHITTQSKGGVGGLREWKEFHQAVMANSNSAEQIELRIQFHGQM